MTTPQQQIIEKCKQVVERARTLYGMDLSNVSIHFDIKGKSAGRARSWMGRCSVHFNYDMLTRESFDMMLNDTVPHEFAHIVCFKDSSLGSGHNAGWARVCRALGGTGNTYHKEEVVYGKGLTYEYTTTNGHKVRIGDRMHNNLQRGQTYTYRKGIGRLTKECAYTIVGQSGRTLSTPIVRKAEPTVTPAVPAIVQQARTSFVIGTAPVTPTLPAAPTGQFRQVTTSKAAMARSIMLAGKNQGQDYETIISAIMHATGHDRQLARATYKANAAKVGITL